MNKKTVLVLSLFALAIIGIIAPVNSAVESSSSENKAYTIETKEKVAKFKLTWNGNGGTIGKKKIIVTTVTKGKKIGKLPKDPTRAGFTFKGWFTKKTGGTKITKDTKPTKSVTYYAQWENNNKPFIGKWEFTLSQAEKKNYSKSMMKAFDIGEYQTSNFAGNSQIIHFKEGNKYTYSYCQILSDGSYKLITQVNGEYSVNKHSNGKYTIDLKPYGKPHQLAQKIDIGTDLYGKKYISFLGTFFYKVPLTMEDMKDYVDNKKLVGQWKMTYDGGNDYSVYTFYRSGEFTYLHNGTDGCPEGYHSTEAKGSYSLRLATGSYYYLDFKNVKTRSHEYYMPLSDGKFWTDWDTKMLGTDIFSFRTGKDGRQFIDLDWGKYFKV